MPPKRCCVSDRRVQSLHSKLYRPRHIDKQESNEDIRGVSISHQLPFSKVKVRRGDARSSSFKFKLEGGSCVNIYEVR